MTQRQKPALRSHQNQRSMLVGAVSIWFMVALLLFLMPNASQTYVVTNTQDSGLGSLREAILDANRNPGTDSIKFNIPGRGPHLIRLQTALPRCKGDIYIDGYSQPGTVQHAPGIIIEGKIKTRSFDAFQGIDIRPGPGHTMK